MLKGGLYFDYEVVLIFKKNANFTGKQLENSQDQECKILRVLF